MNAFLELFSKLTIIEKKAEELYAQQGQESFGFDLYMSEIRKIAVQCDDQYSIIRDTYTRKIPRTIEITNMCKVSHTCQISGALIEGGGHFSGSIYQAVLNPPSKIYDINCELKTTANQVIGCLENKLRKEFYELINPLFWIWQFILTVFKLPLILIKSAGYDTKIFEEHLWGNMFLLLYAVGLIYICLYVFGIPVREVLGILKIIP